MTIFNRFNNPLNTFLILHFIFDIEDDSVSKATNFTLPNTDDVGLWTIYNTGLDRKTGTYYIYMNGVSGDPFNPAKLLKMSANASSYSYSTEFNRPASAGRVIETPSTAYLAIDIATGYQIYDLPSPTLLTTTDGVNGSTARTWVFGDDNLDVIWQLNDAENKLVGFSLTGGADITIELDWTPYTQPDDRKIVPIMIHRGMYIVSVLSYNNSTFASQNELVVLGV